MKNKEWFFSGIGIFFLTTMAVLFRVVGRKLLNKSKHYNKYDFYISTPIVGLENEIEFRESKLLIDELIHILTENNSVKIFSYISQISNIPLSGAASTNIKKIYEALRNSNKYVGIFPSRVITGAYVEAGFALALHKPSIYFVKDMDHLPTILKKAPTVYNFVDIQIYKNDEDLKRLFKENGKTLFIKKLK